MFSDERVALAFNARFVSVWENRDPRARFTDHTPRPERYIFQPDEDLPIGTGETNVTCVFATPEGHILNAVPGYLTVEALFEEMRVALAVRERTMDGEFKLKPGASRAYTGIHRAAANLWGPTIPGRAHDRLAKLGMGVLGKDTGSEDSVSRSQAFHRLLASHRREPCGQE